ncbi:MAG: MFS transporter [Kiloniellales bacterium]|nr:MFS transporter [Kiloniellales bacterium]
MTAVAGADLKTSKGAIAAWCLFDWANSAFPTVIITFVFAQYVTKAVAPDEIAGTAAWGQMISLSALGIAILAPILGAIADHSGRRKPWILFFSLACLAVGSGLWWILPEPGYLLPALVLVAIANAAFEFGQVFYNAMLPDLAPRRLLGRISGWAWACGYAGGIACLVICLLAFALPEEPILGLDTETYEQVRITGPFVALWYLIFALPMFLLTPDRPAERISAVKAVRQGLGTLLGTFRQLRRYGNIARFLLARLFYIDGLNTLFAFGGIYAAGTFGMDFKEILFFGVLLNVTAGLGAVAFAWFDDWFGSKLTILVAVAALTVFGGAILLVEGKLWFYVLGCVIGIFIGPAQAASRTMMARLAPPHMTTEMFGLFAFSGKATAFMGPALVAAVTDLTDSQRIGMSTILVFFLVGWLLMLPVKEPRE